MQIEAGKVYENGWGARVQIVSPPTDKCRWFVSDLGDNYHEDGALMQVGGSPRYNLVKEIPSYRA